MFWFDDSKIWQHYTYIPDMHIIESGNGVFNWNKAGVSVHIIIGLNSYYFKVHIICGSNLTIGSAGFPSSQN